MAHAVPHVDELLREYLLFRGFTDALADKAKGFSVDKILTELHALVSAHNLDGLVEFWDFLQTYFFSRLDSSMTTAVDALETALLRYFLVHAVEADRRDVVSSFFTLFGDRLFAQATAPGSGLRRGTVLVPGAAARGSALDDGGSSGGGAIAGEVPSELRKGVVGQGRAAGDSGQSSSSLVDVLYVGSGGADWLEWFALPVLDNPQAHPTFKPYFSKAWVDNFAVSLANFLKTVFQAIPLPKLLAFNQERLRRQALEAQVRSLQSEVHRLRAQLQTASSELADMDRKRKVASTIRVQRVETHAAERSSRHSMAIGAASRVVESARPRAVSGASRGALSGSDAVVEEVVASPQPEPMVAAAAAAATGGVASRHSADPAPATRESPLPGGEEPFIVLNQEVFAEHKAPITKCLFSADGSSIASASKDGTVRLWTFSSFPSSRNAVIRCSAPVLSLEWEPMSDRLLLAGTAQREIKLWSVNEKKELYTLLAPAHVPRVTTLACSPSSQLFVAGLAGKAAGGELHVWDLRTLQPTMELGLSPEPTANTSLAFNHNGRMLVAGGADGMIRVFDMSTGTPIMGWPAHDGAAGGVTGVAFTNDETSVVSHGADGKFTRWSLHSLGSELYMYNTTGLTGTGGGELSGLAMDGDGEYMIVGTSASHGAIYHVEQHAPVQTLGGHGSAVRAVDWHPTLNCAITGSADATVRVSKLIKAL
ncbi:WD repeat-containing protein 91 [Thecamonas trahens ATCC 50062]|uniref:WD repeat-containing protein 91 n=1 Tax=Thecamonas trahens ATCC 50062 TaxID=461836 RepID=A0A0L0DVU6_THETB|nr:WD repeat-containing protein 91 [Thecamonas trahens ATCC 50062]KNC55638.1 WD repeat-containing protein 91 [Thecamonas trahens ATCC 50062]|eukprot:XP_013761408.1 WD repeat-containing protein 91 [Thecamonas trahens ATCC 50062]